MKTKGKLLSAVLSAIVAVSCFPLFSTPAQAAQSKISVKTIKTYARDEHYKIPDEFLEEFDGKSSVSHTAFLSTAIEHNISSEFVQLFFEDSFVFRGGDQYDLIPIDTSLEQNDYDWDNLVYMDNNEVKYVKGGKRRAIKGIDVSKHQGEIDWERVYDDGVRFAFIRLGYRGYGTGKLMIDGYYKDNIENATAAGVKVGVYFFSQAKNTQEAVNEAEVVLRNIKGYDVDYPIVFDMEGAQNSSYRTYGLSRKQMTDIAIAFCDRIEEAGYHPMLYSYTKFLATEVDFSRLEDYDLWLANYYKVPFFPYDFQILQYTSKGKVDGIKGNVDMNLCFKDYE